MIKIICIICLLIVGCSKNDENWDIPYKNVEKIELEATSNNKSVEISESDAKRIIETFNSVQPSDIYQEYHEDIFIQSTGIIKITTKEELMNIHFFDTGVIYYNDAEYYLELDNELFDLLRELEIKYDLKFINWETDLSYEGLDGYFSDGVSSWFFTYSSTELNKTYEKFNKSTRVDDNVTFNDLLKDKELKLNDVVETEDMKIIVIRTTDGIVDIVGFKFK